MFYWEVLACIIREISDDGVQSFSQSKKLTRNIMKQFSLSVATEEGTRVINFANNSNDFVEVIFAIDGKEVKEGKKVDFGSKGYGYPPKLEKPVKRMRNGEPLQFSPKGGEVMAYVFAGEGEYKNEDLDKPTFLRNKLVDRIKFKRASDNPIQTIKTTY